MKIHTYLACFFLPFLLLYVLTGVLYFFDIEGSNVNQQTHKIALSNGWPESENDAKQYVLATVKSQERLPFPPEYFVDDDGEWVSWYGYKQEILLWKTANKNEGKLELIEHDLLQQLMLIHKGHAGIFLLILAIMFGFSMLSTMISGVVLAVTIPSLRKISTNLVLAGFGVLLLAYVFGY